jgi:hypothetical protein
MSMATRGTSDVYPPEPPPRVLGTIWALLLINALGYSPVDVIVRIPKAAAQLVTMGALGVAFLLALTVNRRLVLRPNAFLLLMTLLVVSSTAASMQLESGMGAFFRCFRFAVFVATLWLLTPWWRGDLRFAVYQIRTMSVFLLTVVLGMVLSPSAAFSGPDGRLVGAIWPITAPQVGLYCAIATGLTVILWMGSRINRRSALVIAVPAFGLLLLSHTRTALLGLVVALLVAGASMAPTSGRVRRALVGVVACAGLGWLFFWNVVYAFMLRGQDEDQLTSFTGRAKVWNLLLTKHRTPTEEMLGVGLTDKSFGGLPIDSSWLSIYHEEGLVGIALVTAFLLVLLITASLRAPSTERACAIFLVVYNLSASYTEVGLGDASPYLLNLAVAASLLASGTSGRRPPVTAGSMTASHTLRRRRGDLDPVASSQRTLEG